MEDVEKPPVVNLPVGGMKNNIVYEGTVENSVATMESDVCHKSNGVVESINTDKVADAVVPANETTAPDIEVVAETTHDSLEENVVESPSETVDTGDIPEAESVKNEVTSESLDEETGNDSNIKSVKPEYIIEHIEESVVIDEPEIEESIIEIDGIVESTNDRPSFKTEIVVETNIDEMNENKEEEIQNVVSDNDTNLLNELGQNMELSEMLRSSDTNENVENNNCEKKQEVFNKEELLDILEGNNVEEVHPSKIVRKEVIAGSKPSEPSLALQQQLALQQLSRLKSTKKRKYEKKQILHRKETERKLEENIVTELVKEWEDDEPAEVDQSKNIIEDSERLLKSSNDLVKAQENLGRQDERSVRSSLDSATSDKQTPNQSKSGDEGLPQRRLGRIIKKKVIFDPDNPDTFTKGKSATKNKESPQSKDHLPIKKIKSDQANQQPKARSPMAKLQWKKPPPKNSKRLTEVDKLLMDEGAVNMIYQLTPEADKGKKNMRTKAEIIKNLQRSIPDSKEMKFRERKKDSKYEDGEPRKIAGGKQRPSLGSSVKSPSVSEDFEAHSADDSIIYRRHSSSSYSSSCMSPRRLSDGESGAVNNSARTSQQVPENQDQTNTECDTNANVSVTDTFVTENTGTPKKLINKSDCLSIKEKLNSKLSLVLNKRKQETTTHEKPKQRKVSKSNERLTKHEGVNEYKYLSINIDNRLGEICIKKSGSNYNIEVIKELDRALLYINSRDDVSVTLLTSDCGVICSGLDLRSLLINDSEARSKYAFELADSIRSLLLTMDQHCKLLCMGVGSSCSSLGLALLAMSDVTLASESASFVLDANKFSTEHSRHGPLVPGLSVLIASSNQMSKSLLSDLMVFGHRLSASDALRYGLVSRTLWPERFQEQLRNIAKDMAIQPMQVSVISSLHNCSLFPLFDSKLPTHFHCITIHQYAFLEHHHYARKYDV
ncbi:hypothetical protein O3G_MSEX003534 [Manduca sexta]|uniref:Uncharacterized protein n=1 Tax=Manduca sexta TaxID=7130 RepID=A0A922CG12_MANSE|nr:hypothetical protein O3G_MSEX003534 [Manduca sexta]